MRHERRKNKSTTSKENVENVVKPPQSPTAKKRRLGWPQPRSIAAAEKTPSANDPSTLIANVGHGKVWSIALVPTPIQNRKLAPRAAPKATANDSLNALK